MKHDAVLGPDRSCQTVQPMLVWHMDIDDENNNDEFSKVDIL